MKKEPSRPRGRPRKFDRAEVLESALDTFWAKGYSDTSLDDLTGAMGINRPSLYASFGNKHDLFMESIDRYSQTIGRRPLDAFADAPDIRDAVAAYFETTIQCVTSRNRPNGCLIMNVASERSVEDPEVRKKVSASVNGKTQIIAERIADAQQQGQITRAVEPDTLARMIVMIMQSLASRARTGATRKELAQLADGFMVVLFATPDERA